MLPYFMPEITPLILNAGVRRFGGLAAADAAGNVRAVAEAQAMGIYLHSAWVGKRPGRVLITAGGSGNQGLLTVMAHVFGAEVQTLEVKEGAALGAALRAAQPGPTSAISRFRGRNSAAQWRRPARSR